MFNVGRGLGFSVLEVLDAVRAVLGRSFDHQIAPARAGDPASLVAAVGRIDTELRFSAHRDLTDMVASAWSAWQAFPPR